MNAHVYIYNNYTKFVYTFFLSSQNAGYNSKTTKSFWPFQLYFSLYVHCLLWNQHCSWGAKCLWLLWVTIAHELTSPRTYTQSFTWYLLKLSQWYTTNEITSLQTRKIFGYIGPQELKWFHSISEIQCHYKFERKSINILLVFKKRVSNTK